MQPIRQILEEAPDFIPVPEALRHRKIELIIWPLEEEAAAPSEATDASGWPVGFFERTAGAWQGEPLEREPQGEYKEATDANGWPVGFIEQTYGSIPDFPEREP